MFVEYTKQERYCGKAEMLWMGSFCRASETRICEGPEKWKILWNCPWYQMYYLYIDRWETYIHTVSHTLYGTIAISYICMVPNQIQQVAGIFDDSEYRRRYRIDNWRPPAATGGCYNAKVSRSVRQKPSELWNIANVALGNAGWILKEDYAYRNVRQSKVSTRCVYLM